MIVISNSTIEGPVVATCSCDDENWRQHTLAWVGTEDVVTLGYRPVHTDPLTPESEGGIALAKIAPKARVY